MAKPTPKQAFVIGRVIDVRYADGQTGIIQEILIDCPGCGRTAIRFAGEHLRDVYRLLARTIENYPDKTGHKTEGVLPAAPTEES